MKFRAFVSIVVLFALVFGLCACAEHSQKLEYESEVDSLETVQQEPVKGNDIEKGKPLRSFSDVQKHFSLQLLNASAAERDGENILLSPLSIHIALSMAANGADGDTAAEMLSVLGGGLSLEELNASLKEYTEKLSSDKDVKINIANSVWLRDKGFSAENEFLRLNEENYKAEIFKAPFDRGTVNDINRWIKKETDGMIDKMIDDLSDNSVMCLINALLFDAEWDEAYLEQSVTDGTFTSYKGKKRTVEMMHGSEYQYLQDDHAVGFMKDYKGSKYAFAALLPDEDTDIYDYIASLSVDKLNDVLGVEHEEVITSIPKFDCEYSTDLSETLRMLGMPLAFDSENADFSKLGKADYNIFIGRVLHKTNITVAEKGTKAGAATLVEMYSGAAMPEEEPKEVILDRPFVYMILDKESGVPLFIGALCDIDE